MFLGFFQCFILLSTFLNSFSEVCYNSYPFLSLFLSREGDSLTSSKSLIFFSKHFLSPCFLFLFVCSLNMMFWGMCVYVCIWFLVVILFFIIWASEICGSLFQYFERFFSHCYFKYFFWPVLCSSYIPSILHFDIVPQVCFILYLPFFFLLVLQLWKSLLTYLPVHCFFPWMWTMSLLTNSRD